MVNTDVMMLLAQYVEYGTMLSLLAANPTPQFVRGLYNHDSDFWHRRLGAQTGRGCLVAADGSGEVATDVPWTRKAQHDALTTRCGRLFLSTHGGGDDETTYLNDSLLLATNRRVKAVASAGSPNVYEDDDSTELAVVALWEDGTVRSLYTRIRSVVFNSDINTLIEDDEKWEIVMGATSVPRTPFSYEENSTSPLPLMRTMTVINDMFDGQYILALDYEGILWYTPLPSHISKIDKHCTMSRVSSPTGVPGRILHVGKALGRSGRRLGSRAALVHTIPIITTEDGTQYMLRFHEMAIDLSTVGHRPTEQVNAYVPVYIPVDASVEAIVGSYPRCMIGEPNAPSTIDAVVYPAAQYMATNIRFDDISLAALQSPEDNDIQYSVVDGRLVAIVDPQIGTDIAGPAPTHCSPTKGELSTLESALGIPQDDYSAMAHTYQTPLLPKWMLGASPYTSEDARYMQRVAVALDRLNHTPYLAANSTDYSDASNNIVYILRPDGSIDIVAYVRTIGEGVGSYGVGPYESVVIHNKAYGMITAEWEDEYEGEPIEAMVYIAVPSDQYQLLYGIGV